MTFLNIMDFKSKDSTDVDGYLHLNADREQGIDTIPDMDINITSLNKSGVNRFNHFFNNGYGGITFKATIVILKEETWNNKKVTEVLHDWFINMTPLIVVTDAMDVPDGQYLITKNPSRKQKFNDGTVWELEFTTYTPLTIYKFKNDNSAVLEALNKAKAAQKSNSTKRTTYQIKLGKCNYKVLVYSKKKKVVECVKYLQQVLKQKKHYSGAIDGWYGKDTTKAVKKFQKNYNMKHSKTKSIAGAVKNGAIVTKNTKTKGTTIITGITKVLPENGKVNKATWKALCGL